MPNSSPNQWEAVDVNRRRPLTAVTFAAMIALGGCGFMYYTGPPPIQTGAPCAFCRMTIADTRLAAELTASGEEPRQYDDIGCLLNDLKRQPAPAGSRAWVADYESGNLRGANDVVYTRVAAIDTPMGSHLVAQMDEAARKADPRTREGQPLTAHDLFGPAGPPRGADAR
jgi:copper chaperone NosL